MLHFVDDKEYLCAEKDDREMPGILKSWALIFATAGVVFAVSG